MNYLVQRCSNLRLNMVGLTRLNWQDIYLVSVCLVSPANIVTIDPLTRHFTSCLKSFGFQQYSHVPTHSKGHTWT